MEIDALQCRTVQVHCIHPITAIHYPKQASGFTFFDVFNGCQSFWYSMRETGITPGIVRKVILLRLLNQCRPLKSALTTASPLNRNINLPTQKKQTRCSL